MNPVVIDTNCLLQIISRKSPYRPIWDAFIAGCYDLCVSNDILDEYQEILEQQITPTVAENVVMLILNQLLIKLLLATGQLTEGGAYRSGGQIH